MRANVCRCARLTGRRIRTDRPIRSSCIPDVRRMLLTQKALIEGGRALAYYTAQQADLAEFGPPRRRDDAETMLSFLTPIVKAFLTEMRVRKRQSRGADLRRSRFHSRDRGRTVRARQSDHADLRRHDADSGARSARPQSDDDARQGAARVRRRNAPRCRRNARGRCPISARRSNGSPANGRR